MSLARAFTKRIKRDDDIMSNRSKTVRYAAGSIRRDMISLPTELISTTNVQALNAPDIATLNKSTGSSSSVSSNQDSDFSTFDKSFLSDHDKTDSSSIEMSSPATPVTPPMDQSGGFFDTKPASGPVQILSSDPVPDTPAVPQRAPSHSKKAHVELSRQRSLQRLSPPPSTIPEKPRNSAEFFGATTDGASHPFGKELAKVNEVAEDFGASATVMEEEEREILGKGFHKFSVEDYINEIAGLYGGVFDGRLGPVANPWI